MAATRESWENVYSGFDRCDGYLAWVMEDAARHLPAPQPTYRCRKNGHRWKKYPSFWPNEVQIEGCVRCAKAGLVVLRTTDIREAA